MSPTASAASEPLPPPAARVVRARRDRARRGPALRAVAVALAYAFGGCVALGQDTQVTVETVKRVTAATVPVVCGKSGPNGTFTLSGTKGSAFFVNADGYFVTAAHVLAEWDKKCVAAVYLPFKEWGSRERNMALLWFSFGNCLFDLPNDVAVCRTEQNPFQHPSLKGHAAFVELAGDLTLPDGMPVAFTGFPMDFLRPVTSKGNLASYLPAQKEFMVDKTAWPGASGSPLYLADGSVIGVLVQAGVGMGGGLAYARAIEPVAELLTKSRINFHQQQKRQQAGSHRPPPLPLKHPHAGAREHDLAGRPLRPVGGL